jgi:hypothetical protein
VGRNSDICSGEAQESVCMSDVGEWKGKESKICDYYLDKSRTKQKVCIFLFITIYNTDFFSYLFFILIF